MKTKNIYKIAGVNYDECLIKKKKILLWFLFSLIKIIPQTQFSYRRDLTGMAYRSSFRDLINLHIETKY